ncbi:MAG: polysaccharide pyruvyl transferase family protein [Clostridia bacterium]|nr:polysaccharide pyruvyl transferase family protein [Clostridia bacterium]
MIGVCIKYFHANYGGMLQAYATVSMLEKQGLNYELIQYEKKRTTVEKIRSLPRLLNRVLLNDKYETLKKRIGEKRHPEFARNNGVRLAAFRKFEKEKFTKLSPVFVGYDGLCQGSRRYSAVITGSDQLWSPAGLPTNYYNLMFVPDDVLKISLASSFGVTEIPWYQKKRTRQFLNRIEHVSMRENRGSEIVKELTGREVDTILDPVFFLSKEEWDQRVPDEKIISEPYVFAYFLGANPEYRSVVTKFAKQKGLKVVALRHMDQYVPGDESFGDIAPYDVDPKYFLNLLRNAEYVFTDSFHGTAFSVINEKQFIVFNRYQEGSSVSKNSRIDTLCQNFGLESRRYQPGKDLIELTSELIDYSVVSERFKQQKQITDQYMSVVLTEIRARESQ